MTLSDAILLAGGFMEDSWTLEAEIARVMPKGMGEDTLAYIRFPRLPDFADSSATFSPTSEEFRAKGFSLRHRDLIFVRENPEFKTQKTVVIDGEVKFPGEYALRVRNERLSDVIARAGGATKAGYVEGGRMTRRGTRVNIDFEKAIVDENEDHDIILQPGDVISIPPKPNSVAISGEVNNPGILGYIDGEHLWSYIDRAGGLTDSANYVLVTNPSGNVEKFGTGWFHSNPRLADGSTIAVTKYPPPLPEKEGESLATTIKDIFAITTSAATLAFIVWQFRK